MMTRKSRIVFILFLLVGLLGLVAYTSIVYLPVQDRELPTLVYFHAGD